VAPEALVADGSDRGLSQHSDSMISTSRLNVRKNINKYNNINLLHHFSDLKIRQSRVNLSRKNCGVLAGVSHG
jgi:hypothetical protein